MCVLCECESCCDGNEDVIAGGNTGFCLNSNR